MTQPTDPYPDLPIDPDLPAPEPAPHFRLRPLLMVLVGGAAGTLIRYAVGRALPESDHRWPWATLLVNLVAAFTLGVLLEALARRVPDEGPRQLLRLLLGTGLCGALSTYSTFALEVVLLARGHRGGVAVAYAVVTVVAGLALVALGIALAGLGGRRAVGDGA